MLLCRQVGQTQLLRQETKDLKIKTRSPLKRGLRVFPYKKRPTSLRFRSFVFTSPHEYPMDERRDCPNPACTFLLVHDEIIRPPFEWIAIPFYSFLIVFGASYRTREGPAVYRTHRVDCAVTPVVKKDARYPVPVLDGFHAVRGNFTPMNKSVALPLRAHSFEAFAQSPKHPMLFLIIEDFFPFNARCGDKLMTAE